MGIQMMSDDAKVAIFEPARPRTIDDKGIALLEEILAGAKAGTVTAFAVAAKDAGYAVWTGARAYRNVDRFNLMGQLHSLLNVLDQMEYE
jgi:hypothetical protein